MTRPFLTVAEELLEHAECAADYFEEHGYAVEVEQSEIGYPYTPTLRCERTPTTMLVEVYGSILHQRIGAWSRYGRSCSGDTRVAIILPSDVSRLATDESKLRELGVGLYVSDGRRCEEAIVPRDLAINVELPELRTLPPAMRPVLGPVYEQFNRSQWREGFEEACKAVEVHARNYLWAGISSGRVVLVTPGGTQRPLRKEQVDRMTIGQLAEAFGQIQLQNYSDATIGKVLGIINGDRVGVVHHKTEASTEAQLRQNVGQHMWRIVAVLRELGLR